MNEYTCTYIDGKLKQNAKANYTELEVSDVANLMHTSDDEARRSLLSVSNFLNAKAEKYNYVSSKKYLDWLYDFVKSENVYDDESALYDMKKGLDKENLLLLSYLQTIVAEFAEQNHVENQLDKENEFECMNYVFKYKDKYFNITTMTGQGSCTFINILKDMNKYKGCIVLNPQ